MVTNDPYVVGMNHFVIVGTANILPSPEKKEEETEGKINMSAYSVPGCLPDSRDKAN